ncbi:hypothetical protein TNCV_1106791 [Trichonephila clavipes]|nr:hypothetical protein TNCV_1106791 [Trichonephila clavipes]
MHHGTPHFTTKVPGRKREQKIQLHFEPAKCHRHPWSCLQQDNARPHVAKTVRDFCSAQHMQLLPWPAYLPYLSPIEHVWDSVG